MSEIATIKKAEDRVPAPSNYEPSETDPGAQMMAVVARAASDPTVDVDKMERLLDMQERMLNRNARVQYAEAMVEVQKHLPRVIRERSIRHESKDKKGVAQVISTYASWEDIDKAIRPTLDAHGFSLTFRVETQDDRTVVTAVLMHSGGHEERTGFRLPLDTGGAKNNVQAYGSTITYGKRYTACALLNIVTEDDDTDGTAPPAEESKTVTDWKDRIDAARDVATLSTVTGPAISSAKIAKPDLDLIRKHYTARLEELQS